MKVKRYQYLPFSIIEYNVESGNETDVQQVQAEYHDLAIIGGNIIGLSCGFFSNVKDFIILDQKHQIKELSFKQEHITDQVLNKKSHLSLLYNQLGLKSQQTTDLQQTLINFINKRLRLNSHVIMIRKDNDIYEIRYVNEDLNIKHIYASRIVFNLPLSIILNIATEAIPAKDQDYFIEMEKSKSSQIETSADSSIIVLKNQKIHTTENAVRIGYLAAEVLNKAQQE